MTSSQVTTAAIKALTLRQYGLWAVRDDPSYFSGGYLTYDNLPARRYKRFATHASGDSQWEDHLMLLQEQLQDFQAAAAAALALNRTLILPRVLCSCVYGQWPFISSGNLNCQPMHMQGLFPRMYECPPSYWLSIPAVLRSDVPLREPSFLGSERAKPLRESRVALHACDAPRSPGAAAGSVTSDAVVESTAQLCTVRGVPLVRAKARSDEFAAALAPLHRARVLHLAAPRQAVGGFGDAAAAASFARRVGGLLGAWCCAGKDSVARLSGARGRLGRRGGSSPALTEITQEYQDSLLGAAFQLRFRPPLGVLGGVRRAAAAQWEVVARVNNVFGRAELRADSSCCKYIGQAANLMECVSMAEKRTGGRPATSVTWHQSGRGEWHNTCYAIIDGTWQPVPVERGQAEADSARRSGGNLLGPAPELATAWITDR